MARNGLAALRAPIARSLLTPGRTWRCRSSCPARQDGRLAPPVTQHAWDRPQGGLRVAGGIVPYPCRSRAIVTDAQWSDAITIPHFREIMGHDPYPWQRCLYRAFVEGKVPESLDIPTGPGKTLCVLLFLLARVRNAALPTRIVYIVDRRAIVDQTAEAVRVWIERIAELPQLARALDERSAFPSALPVQLGVLRGGQADDGEWRVDPTRPAVVVGTVDMIGSRLMFSG